MKHFKQIVMTLYFGFLLAFAVNSQNAYSIIYEANKKGERIEGNLEQLMKHVQNGNPIRVGWVLKFKDKDGSVVEMQHWADAGFITTLKGHVFAQIKSIYQQGPVMSDPPGVFLVSDKANGWVAVIGTTGVMRQKYTRDEKMIKMMKDSGLTEKQVEEQLKEMEIMEVHTKWAVQNKS